MSLGTFSEPACGSAAYSAVVSVHPEDTRKSASSSPLSAVRSGGRGFLGGLRIVLGVMLGGVLASMAGAQPLPEPCPEGLFRDLSSDSPECRYLDFPFLGASPSIPEQSVFLDPGLCTRQEVQAALDGLGQQGGGTLHLPACVIEVDEPVIVPSQVALVGAGPDQTELRPAPSYGGTLLRVKRATDVRIAHLALDGLDRSAQTLDITYSRHVLIEGIVVQRITQNGLIFNQSRYTTIRYSAFRDIDVAGSYNGIGAKDCYPDRGDTDEASCVRKLRSLAQNDYNKSLECATSYCPCDMAPIGEGPGYCYGYGSEFTTHYVVYSNSLNGMTNDYCLALHARNGEVAGNLCENGKHGMKSPDAWDIYVHDNLFRDNTGWGYFAYGPIKGIHPRRLHLYRNHFVRHGDVPLRTEGPEGLYLVHNVYEDNCRTSTFGYCTLGGNVIVNNEEIFFDSTKRAPETYICSGFSAEDILNGNEKIQPFAPLYADAVTCAEILPLEIVEFAVHEVAGTIKLAWRTESESAIAWFDVEQSTAGEAGLEGWSSWSGVGQVYARGGPADGRTYRWEHPEPDLETITRYRLRQVNRDGSVFLSPSVEWRPAAFGGLTLSALYPSPARSRAAATLVSGTDRYVRVALVGMRGEHLARLFDGQLSAGVPIRLTVDVAEAPAGMAFVVVEDGLRRIVQPLIVAH